MQVERFLAAAFARMAARFAAEVRRIVLPKIDDLARWPERHDAKGDSKPLLAAMRSAASRSFSQQAVRSVSEQAARRTEAHSRGEFRRIGINVKKEPDLKWLVNGWAKDQAQRVTGMAKEQVDKLAAILGTAGARHAETIAREIEEQLGVTEQRADFIARDSIATLNTKITRHRAEAAGVERYIWTTVGDDRVRPEHADLDGKVFDIDDGDPEEGQPGDAPNCRCTMYILPPEKGGDDGEDADE